MILHFVTVHLKLLGIIQSHGKQWSSIYIRILFVFASLGIFTMPTLCFLLCEAITFDDYVNSFFFTSCGMLGISFYAVLLWEKANINKLIVDLEYTVQKRSKFLRVLCSIQIWFSSF